MKYEVTVGGQTFVVDIDGHAVRIGGRETTGRLNPIPGTPLVRLALGGLSATFVMERTPGGWKLLSRGKEFVAEVTDERSKALQRMVGGPKRRAEGGLVKAPMPGLVLRVEVAEGQAVQPGTGLLVLEAMKMENEIRAAVGGVVKRLMVKAGQVVERGTELLEIEVPQG